MVMMRVEEGGLQLTWVEGGGLPPINDNRIMMTCIQLRTSAKHEAGSWHSVAHIITSREVSFISCRPGLFLLKLERLS